MLQYIFLRSKNIQLEGEELVNLMYKKKTEELRLLNRLKQAGRE